MKKAKPYEGSKADKKEDRGSKGGKSLADKMYGKAGAKKGKKK